MLNQSTKLYFNKKTLKSFNSHQSLKPYHRFQCDLYATIQIKIKNMNCY